MGPVATDFQDLRRSGPLSAAAASAGFCSRTTSLVLKLCRVQSSAYPSSEDAYFVLFLFSPSRRESGCSACWMGVHFRDPGGIAWLGSAPVFSGALEGRRQLSPTPSGKFVVCLLGPKPKVLLRARTEEDRMDKSGWRFQVTEVWTRSREVLRGGGVDVTKTEPRPLWVSARPPSARRRPGW